MATEAPTNMASNGSNAPATPPPAAAAPEATPPSAEPPTPTQPEPAAKPDKEQVDFSTRFAALTRKERAIQEREKALKAAEKELSDYKKAREGARTDPIGYLEAAGLSYDQVTQFVLNDRKLTPEQKVALLEEQLQKDRADREAKAKADAEAEEQAVIDNHKRQIRAFVDGDGDTFELIRANEAYEMVWDVIENHFQTSGGEILPIPQAAKSVEDWLEQQAREKILKLKKFAPKVEVKDQPAPPPPTTDKQAAPTLTNKAVHVTAPADRSEHLSDDESKRRAAALLRWN